MARTRLIQNSLISGVIAPTLLGRIDLKKYYNAVEEAENVTIMPHGGMERRPGLRYLTSVTTGSRLFSFEFSITQNYVFVMSTASFKVYTPGTSTLLATVSWSSALTQTQLDDMDIIQSADTIIITHEDFNPITIQRQGSDSSWAVSDMELRNIPRFDFDSDLIPDYYNYGEDTIYDIQTDEIVFNNDGNDVRGIDGYLYKALYDVSNADTSLISYKSHMANWTNDGTSQVVTVAPLDLVLNSDGDDTDGLDDHAYLALVAQASIDLANEDFSDTTKWMDNGIWENMGLRPKVWGQTVPTFLYTNTGASQTVTVDKGGKVLNADGNAVNGEDDYVYQAVSTRTSIDLSTEDFSNTTYWRSTGPYIDTDRGWPRTCTFHQGRLVFGGSKDKPTSVWCSVVNDFYNFDTGGASVVADDAIFDILDTDQFNAIQNVVSGRNLQVLTAGGEFVNTAEVLTPTTSGWVRSTSYGSSRVKPVTLDGATYFMDRHRKTVRGFLYDDVDGGYNTPPISILAEHIIEGVQDMDIVRGTSISVANLMYLVNGDGTVAVFNTMRKEDIAGWTTWTTLGEFKRVTVTDEIVTFIVDRDGTEYLEVLDEDVFLDHTFEATSAEKVEVDAFLYGETISVVADDVNQTTTAAVDESGTYYAYADQTSDALYAGVNYDVSIKTLPVAVQTQAEGNIVNERKRVTKATLNLYQSRGVYIDDILVTSRKFGDATDSVFDSVTGTETTYLLGYNKKTQIEITQNAPDPMTVLSVDLEVSY